MDIKVMDKDGVIFTNNMNNDNIILEIHFCTSYTQFVVQSYIDEKYFVKDIIVPIFSNSIEYAIDMIAIKNEEIGNVVK